MKKAFSNSIFTKKVNPFFAALIISIFTTRLVIALMFLMLAEGSALAERIVTDSLHHYHVGMLLMVSAFFVKRKANKLVLLGAGLGILVEEWAVLFDELGLGTRYLYQSGVDLIIGLLFCFVVWVLWKIAKEARSGVSE